MEELVGLDTNSSSYIHGCDINKAIELAKNYMTLWITAGVVTTSYIISKLK